MTRLLLLLTAVCFAHSSFAQSAPTNAPAAVRADAPAAAAAKPATNLPPGITLNVSNAVLVAPLFLTNGFIMQTGLERTDGLDGGIATFEFSITNAGDYVVHGVANATSEESNSFFLNIDADPEDPLSIWDIEVTTGFEERVVNWRGTGASGSDEFDPKVFKLTAGNHKLIVYGREPDAQLKSLTILPFKDPAAK